MALPLSEFLQSAQRKFVENTPADATVHSPADGERRLELVRQCNELVNSAAGSFPRDIPVFTDAMLELAGGYETPTVRAAMVPAVPEDPHHYELYRKGDATTLVVVYEFSGERFNEPTQVTEALEFQKEGKPVGTIQHWHGSYMEGSHLGDGLLEFTRYATGHARTDVSDQKAKDFCAEILHQYTFNLQNPH